MLHTLSAPQSIALHKNVAATLRRLSGVKKHLSYIFFINFTRRKKRLTKFSKFQTAFVNNFSTLLWAEQRELKTAIKSFGSQSDVSQQSARIKNAHDTTHTFCERFRAQIKMKKKRMLRSKILYISTASALVTKWKFRDFLKQQKAYWYF